MGTAYASDQGDEHPTGLTRVTVNLTPRAADALTGAAEATGDNRTDTINRALQVYDFLITETKRREPDATPGSVVFYLTDPEDPDATERIVLL